MSSSITSVRGSSELLIKKYWHDPADATVATKIAWLPFKGFEWLLAVAMVASAHAFVTVKLFAAEDASGTNPVEMTANAAPTVADAAGDYVLVECTAEQLKEAGALKTHVSVEVDMNTDVALASVTYIFGGAHRKYAGLSADYHA